MIHLHTSQEIHQFIEENKFAFVYIYQENCSVCHSVLPKLEELLKKYPKIALGKVDGEEVKEVAANYQIFSAPALLLFIDGKEYIREGRFVQFQKLTFDLDRLYGNEQRIG